MKRSLSALLALTMLIPVLRTAVLAAPEVSAVSAILVDAGSGRVLYEKNAHERRLIASITKLMTALVAVESTLDLDETVIVERADTLTEGSSMYLQVGEELTLESLLYGLLLSSGNDAALAIARHCAGDVGTFVDWMNQRARSLGMEDSQFQNPNGLNDEAHYSTAADMAKLAMEVMENETLAKIVGTKSISLGTRTLTNHNKLLWQYEGCTGMKTGYTERAGRTLVSCARRADQLLIAVTLSAPNDWADHAALFDYGFATYPHQVLALAGKGMRQIPVDGSLNRFVMVQTASDVFFPLSADEQVEARLDLPGRVDAPVEEGAIAGTLSFNLNGQLIGETYLVYAAAIHSNRTMPATLLQKVKQYLEREVQGMVLSVYNAQRLLLTASEHNMTT